MGVFLSNLCAFSTRGLTKKNEHFQIRIQEIVVKIDILWGTRKRQIPTKCHFNSHYIVRHPASRRKLEQEIHIKNKEYPVETKKASWQHTLTVVPILLFLMNVQPLKASYGKFFQYNVCYSGTNVIAFESHAFHTLFKNLYSFIILLVLFNL